MQICQVLPHAAFDAIFQTEGACYTYLQGHSQVSSFGFGGSNGHGVFWGETETGLDLNKMWQKKLAERPPPEVRVIGKSYEEWEADFPDLRTCKNGTKFKISLGEKDPVDQPIKWEMEEDGPDLDADDDDIFYAITGNFNEWADDRMSAGDVPGSHTTTIDIPDDGVVEFRFLQDGDESKVLCPATDECGRKLEKILGPAGGLTNKWTVYGRAGEELKIELFVKGNMKSVMWLAARS